MGSTATTEFEGRTRGRTASVWGQMAVTTIASTPGTTMGPPADIEYAVDPVGVDTMMPSAEYWPTSSPSTETRSLTTRATPPLWTATSFSTRGSVREGPCLWSMVETRARRGSVA